MWRTLNPQGKQHGGLRDVNSHAGDLGNITANEDGIAKFHFKTDKFTLTGNVKDSVIGRPLSSQRRRRLGKRIS